MMKRILFELVLWPLIKRDIRLRMAGKRTDEWYWADTLAIRLGMLKWYRIDKLGALE
jgi:hypothetical protein